MTNQLATVGVQAVLAGAAQYIRDAAQVNASTAAVTAGVKAASAQTHTTAASMAADFSGVSAATGSLATSLDQLTGPFDGLIEKGREAGKSMLEAAQAAGEGGASGLSAALIGVVAAGAAAVATFVALGTAGAQWATQIQQITSVTGLSQHQAELYKNALELVGGDEQALIRTSFLLERMLTGVAEAEKAGAHPTNELTRAMASLGVEWHDANGNVRDMGQLLPEVIDRLGTMDDRTQAVALSQQIFGRYGIEVTRVVENYANVMPRANELTAEFSTDQVNAGKAALEFQGNLTRLGQAYQFLAVRALPAFLTISGKVVEVITDWVHTNGEEFVANLSNLMLEGVHAIALFAQGFNAVLAPALSAAGAALRLFGDALSAIPTPVIEWIIRLAGYATGLLVVTTAFGLLSTAALALAGSLTTLGVALALTPAGWLAIAAAVAVAGAGYLAIQPQMAAAAQASRDEAEGKKLATQATLDELRAKAALLSAQREENVELLNSIQLHKGSNPERAALLKTIADEDAQLRVLAAAISQDTRELALLDEQQKKAAGSGTQAKTVFEDMGFAAGTTADDIKKMTSEMITATILAENLKKFGGTATPFEIVNSAAFKEQLKVVLDAYKSARVQAEAADQANTMLVNAAGYLTAAQKSAADAAERAGEAAARAAQRAAEEYARYVEKIVADAAAAAKRIREAQVQQLDQLGSLVVDALRAKADEEYRANTASLDASRKVVEAAYKAQATAADRLRDSQIKAAEDARDARIAAAEAARDSEIAAIEASRDAVVAGLNAQIDALRGVGEQNQREGLLRNIALAFDTADRAKAEQALADFDRDAQINALRSTIDTVEQQTRIEVDQVKERTRLTEETANRTLVIEREQIAASSEARRVAIEVDHERAIAALDSAVASARSAYEQQTNDFNLQSQARILLMDKEQQGFVRDLIEKYAPQWQTAGLSLGAQLVEGIHAKIAPYLASLQSLIPFGGGPSGASVNAAALLAASQAQGQAALAGGAPGIALDTIRQDIIAQGGVPEFARGMDWGVVPKPMYAKLDAGEIVLTPDQQRQYMGGGPTFAEGAFAGMFNGATFAGSPQENASEFRRAFTGLMNEVLGRDAHLAGAG